MANDIIERIAEAIPLERGDCTLIASDIKNMCMDMDYDEAKENLNRFIDLLKEKVGSEGTLLFPTYNWNFCKGVTFNYKKTHSKTGALSTIALRREDFTRTHHALYSFAVWGKDAKKLFDMNDPNSFVGDTPFEYLLLNRGKMIAVDTNNFFTFVHYVEEKNQVPYRFLKAFHGKYIDEDEQESERTYTMYVRYLDDRNVQGNLHFHAWMHEQGVQHEQTVSGIPIWLIGFKDSYELITHDIKYNEARHIITRPSRNQ